MNRFKLIFILLIMLTIVLAGCSSGDSVDKNSKVLKAMGKDEKATIKIMYYDEKNFFQQYGNLFLSKFPNIDIKVVSTQGIYGQGKDPKTEFNKLIEEEKPDVLMLSIDQYEKMAADGKLLELDSVIKKDKFDIENTLPAIKDLLKSKGNGKLYGLSPSFYSSALLYNKDLFDQNGIPYPKDQMSWDDVLQLAERFPTDGADDKRIYGFFQNTYGHASVYQTVSMIAGTEGLAFIDAENMKVTITSDGWKRAFQTAIDAIKSKAINQPKATDASSQPNFEDYIKSNLFATGRAAMTVDGYYAFDTIDQAKKQLKDMKPFNWDIVTVPVDPKNPDESSSFGISELYAINAQTDQQRAAWELLKYLNSDELAKIQSRSSQQLLSRTSYIKEKDGHNLEAFYKLKLKSNMDLYKGYENVPINFYQTFEKLANDEIQPVIDGKKTLDDAIKAIQEKGQQALDKAKAEADAAKAPEKK